MKLLLTGGTGFFGRALLRNWVADELLGFDVPEVTVITRSPRSFMERYPNFNGHDWLNFHEGNILSPESLPKGHVFTHVLHAATESAIGPSLPALQRYDDIVTGTRNMLDYAVKNHAERFLLTSSGGVYGPQPANLRKVPESYLGSPDPLDPASSYGIGKRAAEHLCGLYNERFALEPVIARCFSFIGQDLPLRAHFAIGNFIHDALHNDNIVVTGNGNTVRSYMNQADLAKWLFRILTIGVAGHAYNVGSDKAITISQLADRVRDILSPGKSVVFKNTTDTFQGRNFYVPDISLAKLHLDLELKISLDDSIEQFLK